MEYDEDDVMSSFPKEAMPAPNNLLDHALNGWYRDIMGLKPCRPWLKPRIWAPKHISHGLGVTMPPITLYS